MTFSPDKLNKVQEIIARYPVEEVLRRLLPVLHLAQDEFGWISDDAVNAVADALGLPPAHVFGVITFYTMFHRARTGTNNLMVCTNVSCQLKGGYDILHHIEKKLNIKAGETTADGAFTIIEEECLAACANAPMMICGQDYFLDLTPQKVDTILEDLRRRWREQQKQSPVGATLHGVGPASGAKV